MAGAEMAKKRGSQPQRDNFYMVPRIINTLRLSPFAFRLYAEIKDVAGEAGECYESRETLAASCSISTGQVTKAKQELVKAALIQITKRKVGRIYVDNIVVADIWHQNHAMYHQVGLPIKGTPPGIEPPTPSPDDPVAPSPDSAVQPPTPSPDDPVTPLPDDAVQLPTPSPDDGVPSHAVTTPSPDDGVQLPTPSPGDTNKIYIEQEEPSGAKASTGTSIEGFREAMNAAETIQQRVGVVVSLVQAYTREPPKNPGGRAAALLRRYPDPGYVLQAVAQACFTPRAGNLFNYAEGILKGGSHGRRATRVEARGDPADFSRGWWGNAEPGEGSPKGGPAEPDSPGATTPAP